MGCLSLNGWAQSKPPGDTKATSPLETRIQLRSGACTLGDVVRSLSQQTGLNIETEPYLRARRLVVQMDNVTARQALDILCDLNDWKWYDTEPGRYIVTRPKLRPAQELLGIAANVRRALPHDMRRYLGFEVPQSEMARGSGEDFEAMERERDSSASNYPAAERVFRKSLFLSDFKVRFARQKEHLLYEGLRDKLQGEKTIPYAQWTPEQRELILTALTYEALLEMVYQSSGAFWGHLLPYQRDPARITISLSKEGTLYVGSYWNDGTSDGYTAFGSPLLPPFDATKR
jgi:hypothetical protein